MSLSSPIAGLEIGTTRTVIAIGEPRADGQLEITALGAIPSSGVRKSQIIDVGQARYSVEAVLRKLEDQWGYSIGQAYLAVSGPQIRTTAVNTQWQVQHGVVHDDDIAEVDNRACDTGLPPDRTPLELSNIAYGLDDIDNISAPKGMRGSLLRLRSLCIHGDARRIEDARNAAAGAKLEIVDPCFAGTCAAHAVLTPQNKRDGVISIDLGGGSTTYTAWLDGRLVHAGVIGVGGDHLTNDIRIAFSISRTQAEQIKTTAASALVTPDDATARVTIPSATPGFATASISRRALNTVVNARLRELFTIIRTKLDEADLIHRLNAGVVLSGGTAACANIVPLAAAIFGREVRIGTLVPEITGLNKTENPAACATIAGLLLQAQLGDPAHSFMDTVKNMFGGFFKK